MEALAPGIAKGVASALTRVGYLNRLTRALPASTVLIKQSRNEHQIGDRVSDSRVHMNGSIAGPAVRAPPAPTASGVLSSPLLCDRPRACWGWVLATVR
jgi:hypothetical protein